MPEFKKSPNSAITQRSFLGHMMENNPNAESRFVAQWQFRPDVPVQISPFFSWPPKPVLMAKWVSDRWLAVAENSIILILATACWVWFQPSLQEAQFLQIGWVVEIWLRNLFLMIVVAGGLHLYFYRWKLQAKRLKFDGRDLVEKARGFTFRSQVWDNIFWSLTSGVTTWTVFETLMFWCMANGYAPQLTWQDSPVWFVLMIVLTPLWISFHFYWVHRALHWPPLYKAAHGLHHRNTNIGPWSGLSMHPIEHVLFFSSILIHFLLAAHPIHILFHMQHQALTAATSHTGFDGWLIKDKNRLSLGNFHHQMHHRYFECNYGNLEVPWDKVFGSFHDGTFESHQQFQERRKRLMS